MFIHQTEKKTLGALVHTVFINTFTYCLCSIPSSISHALPYRRTLKYKSRLALKSYDISHVVSATKFKSTNRSTKDWAVCVCNKNNIMTYCSFTILKMDKSTKSFFSP